MTSDFLILFILLFITILTTFWQIFRFQNRKWQEFETKIAGNNQAIDVLTQWLHEIRNSLDRQTATLNQQFETTNQVISNRLDNAAKIIQTISLELGQVQEIGRQIQRFQDIIQSPKLRGNIGEQILNSLLAQILPQSNFQFQYRFKKGTIVDAIIFTDKGSIPIDAKFPLNAFRRFRAAKTEEERKKYTLEFAADVKKHIDQVSSRYILPEEGTVEFALIYIPSELIFYEILQNGEQMMNYAHQKRILIVSPNSFFYFLKIILVALEGKRLEIAGREIMNMLNALRQDGQRLSEQLRILTNHLTNAKNALDRVNQETNHLCDHLENSRHLELSENSIPEKPVR